MNWATIEDAIYAWVSTASGVTTIWAGQDAPAPTGVYIALRLSLEQTGQDWVDVEDNPTPTPGAEILQTVRGVRRLTLGIQAFPGTPTGVGSAASLLEKVMIGAKLPSRREALNAAGVGILNFGPIQTLNFTINQVDFEPRASMEVFIQSVSTLTETATFIETVEIDRV